jgi:hypothetical protein
MPGNLLKTKKSAPYFRGNTQFPIYSKMCSLFPWQHEISYLFQINNENLQKSVGPASVLLLEDVNSLLRRPSHLKYQQSTPQNGRKNRQIWRYPASDFECSPLLCCRSLGIYAALVTVAVSFSIGGAHCRQYGGGGIPTKN